MVRWWNKLRFGSLDEVAEYLDPVPYLSEFSAYCRLRHRDLRRLALDALERFIGEAKGWEVARQRQLALWVARVYTRIRQPELFCPVPLNLYVRHVSMGWAEEVDDARPLCVLGIVGRDYDAFRKALELDPSIDFVRAELLRGWVKDLVWATEGLPESFYGIPEEVLSDTYGGLALIKGFVDPKPYAELIETFYTERTLVEEWRRAQAAKGRQSYWSPYIRIQRAKEGRSDDFD